MSPDRGDSGTVTTAKYSTDFLIPAEGLFAALVRFHWLTFRWGGARGGECWKTQLFKKPLLIILFSWYNKQMNGNNAVVKENK